MSKAGSFDEMAASSRAVGLPGVVDGCRRARWARVERVLCVAVLTIGAALRFRQYLAHRALWLDELWLALNVVHRSYRHLLGPLGQSQAAPLGWLWAEKTAVVIFGNNDMVLRAWPLLTSFGSLVLFYLLVRRWLSGASAVLACVLFAFSPQLVQYAVQVKQYGSDVFFVLLVVVMTTRMNDRPSVSNTVSWTLLGVISMWCSHPAVIALGACTLALLVLQVSSPRSWHLVLVASGAFAVSLATEYVVNLRAISRNPALENYWKRGLPPRSFGFGPYAAWLWHALIFLMVNPFHFITPVFALSLAIGGIVVFALQRGARSIIVIAPVAATVVVALLGKYPLRERLSLYLAPFLFVGLAALADARLAAWHPVAPFLGIAAVLLVSSTALASSVSVFWAPTDITDSRGPFATVAAHRQPGDALFIEEPWTEPSFAYYGAQFHLHDTGTYAIESRTGQCDPATQLAGLRHYKRVWFVMTHRHSTEPADRTAIYRSYFATLGPAGTAFTGAGDSGAYLYDVATEPHSIQPKRTWLRNGCITIALAP